jgi:hypothetical protein
MFYALCRMYAIFVREGEAMYTGPVWSACVLAKSDLLAMACILVVACQVKLTRTCQNMDIAGWPAACKLLQLVQACTRLTRYLWEY